MPRRKGKEKKKYGGLKGLMDAVIESKRRQKRNQIQRRVKNKALRGN
jgi:hypothetical protein